MSKEEIALQITLKVVDNIKHTSIEQCKTLPYEIYNSIYNNLDCYKPSDSNLDSISIDNDLEII
ncbi:MAG: hypothetical protein HFJ34_07670 [Clostridia bacterium]|nr:hypothetical protein [Clostridia bacterium]